MSKIVKIRFYRNYEDYDVNFIREVKVLTRKENTIGEVVRTANIIATDEEKFYKVVYWDDTASLMNTVEKEFTYSVVSYFENTKLGESSMSVKNFPTKDKAEKHFREMIVKHFGEYKPVKTLVENTTYGVRIVTKVVESLSSYETLPIVNDYISVNLPALNIKLDKMIENYEDRVRFYEILNDKGEKEAIKFLMHNMSDFGWVLDEVSYSVNK